MQTHRFTWQGIKIEVVYTPRRWSVIDHLEIKSIEPPGAALPISLIGYRSHFLQPGVIEDRGGTICEQVTAWLDDEAAKPEWQGYIESIRQGELF